MDTISIQYEIFGAIKTTLPDIKGEINIPKGTTLKDLLIKEADIKEEHHKYLNITVNGRDYPLNKKLKNRQRIKILLPVGGG
ncbi:MAG: MoaD/ThiS family protein [Spirochaetes bacterium]|nr:MoaD/ThiS family protein [Spirochaetota bacterium]